MATSLSRHTLVALALALAACTSEDGKRTTEPEPDSGTESGGEEDASSEPAPDEDAAIEDAGTEDAETPPVPLTVWVDDLIEQRTTDEAEPDTVDDKKIADDTDETSFDKYLQ